MSAPTPLYPVQTCFACRHGQFGERGTYCPVFGEQIWSEHIAGRDCEAFESSDGKTYMQQAAS